MEVKKRSSPFAQSEGEQAPANYQDIDVDLHVQSILLLLFVRKYVKGRRWVRRDIEELIKRLMDRIKEKGGRGSPVQRHFLTLQLKDILEHDPLNPTAP